MPVQSETCTTQKLIKPILKWAGGKTQLLDKLLEKMPGTYDRYIEPFFGGGALFFALQPENAIIADSNPEIINVYQQIANDPDHVISQLKKYRNTQEMFYEVRAQKWQELPSSEAAARTIYLNHTCFNGLYRVNKNGDFNVPYGKYKNPKICDEENLRAASKLLQTATIICGDYIDVLTYNAKKGDFVYLDPPYMPVGKYSDFKRYTKEQFYEEDHVALSKMVMQLRELGCYVLLTNSNHPLVHELFSPFTMEIVPTHRHISCDGDSRQGEDAIITVPPKESAVSSVSRPELSQQVKLYPPTRFMGSKQKMLQDIWAVADQFQFETVLDLFSGSGVVSYMFKAQGKSVISNDYMAMSATFTKAMVENNSITLSEKAAKELCSYQNEPDDFVAKTFQGLYFSDEENLLIDILRANIAAIKNSYERAIAMSALIRACLKKRPRGIFTYTGERYNDGRKDLNKSLEDQFLEAVDAINAAIFDNGKKNVSHFGDAIRMKKRDVDLVYIDPPYYSPLSDNEYVRRYHFVEGLARNWEDVEIQEETLTKKFKSYPTPFSSKEGTEKAFNTLFKRYSDSILLVSYSSNSQPSQDEILSLLKKYKKHVEVVPVDYRYSFGNQSSSSNCKNLVQEYLFVGF